jgi:adenylosuccinate lyase
MSHIWSEEAKIESWLRVELAATDAWAELGVVPREEAEKLRAVAVAPTPARVAEIEARTQHDLAAFVDAVAEQVGPAARYLHYGLTSSDVLDTALALQLHAAGELILEGIDGLVKALRERADQHRATVMIGRTHGIHAEPTTFGVKLAGFAFELARGRERAESAFVQARFGKISGAVGTYGVAEPRLEQLTLARLELEPEPVSTQIVPRDRHAEVVLALALVAASIERLATEVRHLARTELAEAGEPFGRGQKGSSAMPHKRNPIIAERLCGLSRIVRGAALVALENVPLWHERDISHSSAERIVVPDAFLAVDYMLDRARWLVEGLQVDEERMLRNLEASHGLVFSQRVLLALVGSGMERADAYELVQRNAMRAWDEQRSFRALVDDDEEIRSRLDQAELERAFDLADAVRHADEIVARLQRIDQPREVSTRV